MIEILDIPKNEPYSVFENHYKNALALGQKSIEAIAISSFSEDSNEVESRFVNLKYILNDEWIFFSNYESIKAENFKSHDQISALFYWNKTDVQIRLKAKINKTSEIFSDKHFKQRSNKKNALAISSSQSKKIESYENVKEKYDDQLSNKSNIKRPSYWGGYSFYPYYFEFWEGDKSRVNKRTIYQQLDIGWKKFFLQP